MARLVDAGATPIDGPFSSTASAGFTNRKMVFIGLALALFITACAAAYFYDAGLLFSSFARNGEVAEGTGTAEASAPPDVFYDLPEMLVNLNTTQHADIFMKVGVTLDLASEADVDLAENAQPRIIDAFQSYLRETRAGELNGTAGLSRLRQSLLRRANIEMGIAHVKDVLFRQLIVQ